MKVLVTGGAGYIGSHALLELLRAGHEAVVIDNFCNSNIESVKRVEKLSGKKVLCFEADLTDFAALHAIFSENSVDVVMHFAGLKAVGESVAQPLKYYQNNVVGSLNLVKCMNATGVKNIIFSSSATVYGHSAPVPYTEGLATGATSNPYGSSKAMIEQMLSDVGTAAGDWSVTLLRYFNPVGADKSGEIGEDPQGVPNNLMPFIAQVAVGRRDKLSIFGDDYPTADGTCERDYIHVVDLAKGHVSALQTCEKAGIHIYNLGTGTATSVKEMVQAFERETGLSIPYEIVQRRQGDLPAFWADVSKAEKELGWRAELSIEDMMRDTWRWQQNNPNGYNKG